MIHTWHHGFIIWGKPLPWRCYYFIHTTTDLGRLTGLKWKEPWNDEKTMVSVKRLARWTLHTAVSGLTRRVPNTLHATATWAILKTEQDHLTLPPKRGQRFFWQSLSPAHLEGHSCCPIASSLLLSTLHWLPVPQMHQAPLNTGAHAQPAGCLEEAVSLPGNFFPQQEHQLVGRGRWGRSAGFPVTVVIDPGTSWTEHSDSRRCSFLLRRKIHS